MALQIIDPREQYGLGLFLYGENGSGKTHLAGTLPGETLFVDCMGSPEVLTKLSNYSHIKVVECPSTWNGLNSFWNEPELNSFDNLVFDNLTGLNRVLVSTAMTIPLEKGKRPSPEIPIMRDHGLASERLRFVITKLDARRKHLKQNIAVICHTKFDRDEEGAVVGAGPSLPGQVPAFVLNMFPEIIYMKTEGTGDQTKYIARLVTHGMYAAVTRKLKTTKYENASLAVMYKDFWKGVDRAATLPPSSIDTPSAPTNPTQT
jgi:hypothetical protein